MATSIREEISIFVRGLSGLHLFLIVLCGKSYGAPVGWRCDESRWYRNSWFGDTYKYVTVLLRVKVFCEK